MNLYKTALGGLNAAQAGLATTSHNINNATTVGYNRQRVMTSTAGAQATSNGYIGRGVQVDTVVRRYARFVYKQLVGAPGRGAQMQAQLDQVPDQLLLQHERGGQQARRSGCTPGFAGQGEQSGHSDPFRLHGNAESA
ncbi:hypothetical protein G6F32_015214 [Rhizopus arrhizus]|nr:hypothetical protein G6F32_015214 [Rhizopus arrhizus]